MAAFSSSFHDLATSAASGSSGLGAPRRAWIERRIVRIWRAGDQLSVDLSACCPISGQMRDCHMRTFQDVETDAAKLVDVWVEDLGEKSNLGRCHGVVVREEQLQLECAT